MFPLPSFDLKTAQEFRAKVLKPEYTFKIRFKCSNEPEQVVQYFSFDAAIEDYKNLKSYCYFEYCILEKICVASIRQ